MFDLDPLVSCPLLLTVSPGTLESILLMMVQLRLRFWKLKLEAELGLLGRGEVGTLLLVYDDVSEVDTEHAVELPSSKLFEEVVSARRFSKDASVYVICRAAARASCTPEAFISSGGGSGTARPTARWFLVTDSFVTGARFAEGVDSILLFNLPEVVLAEVKSP